MNSAWYDKAIFEKLEFINSGTSEHEDEPIKLWIWIDNFQDIQRCM